MQHFDSSEFSWQTREKHLNQIPHIQYDLAIVGGGITGSAIALDAAQRGLKTILIEQGDIGSGTSSKSTKLIHGGLRYLENLEFQLVFEARHERGRLLKTAPHLVKEEPVIFPIYRENWPYKKWQLKLGLSIYDAMALGSKNSPHTMLSAEETLKKEPFLRPESLQGSGLFYDCATDDARLTLYTARTAAYWGAAIIPHAKVVNFQRSAVSAAVEGLVCHDYIGNTAFKVNADVVVAAVGPWANEFFSKMGTPKNLVSPSSGIHILLPKKRLPINHTMAVLSPKDHRLLFVRPFNKDFVFIGTTDIPVDSSPDQWFGSSDEVSYLLDVLRYNFPAADIRPHDLVGIWAGLRPLATPSAVKNSYRSSRDHHMEEIEKNVIVVTGGKLTTHHSMAKDCLSLYQKVIKKNYPDRKLNWKKNREPYLIGSEPEWYPENHVETSLLVHLKAKYGSESQKILNYIHRKPELNSKIINQTDDVLAEVLYSLKFEMTLTLSDFFMHRSHLSYYGQYLSPKELRLIADFMGYYLGWGDEKVNSEIEDFKTQLNRTEQALQGFLMQSGSLISMPVSENMVPNVSPRRHKNNVSTKAGA